MKSKTKPGVKKSDWADELSTDQQNQIAEGLQDIKAGRTVKNEKMWAKYNRKA